MFFTKLILGTSSLITFFFPKKDKNFTNYKDRKLLINIWNIYSFTLYMNLYFEIYYSLLFCSLSTIYYHSKLVFNKKINKRFYVTSLLLNLIVFYEQINIIYYSNYE